MKIREIISEEVNVAGVVKAVAPTAISNIVKEFPWAEKLISASPYAAAALQDLISGKASSAAINIIQGILPYARLTPNELTSAGNLLSTGSTMGSVAGHIGASGVATAATPVAMLAAPFMAAGAAKDKINANPTAPEYATNPYAMTVRGEAPTIAAAGNKNRRAAVKNFATAGNPAVPQP